MFVGVNVCILVRITMTVPTELHAINSVCIPVLCFPLLFILWAGPPWRNGTGSSCDKWHGPGHGHNQCAHLGCRARCGESRHWYQGKYRFKWTQICMKKRNGMEFLFLIWFVNGIWLIVTNIINKLINYKLISIVISSMVCCKCKWEHNFDFMQQFVFRILMSFLSK